MTTMADMTRSEVFHWLQFHGPLIGCARDEFVAAAQKYAHVIAKCNGVFENARTTPASFVEDIMDRADAALAEEVQRDLGL